MSGYLGRQRVMEPSTSTSYHTNASTSTLGCSNTARSSGDRSSNRLINGRVRKESKYIENSRQDKLFSRVWLPSQTNLSPKVRKLVYNVYPIFLILPKRRYLENLHMFYVNSYIGTCIYMSWVWRAQSVLR